jgi:hypothetical protein
MRRAALQFIMAFALAATANAQVSPGGPDIWEFRPDGPRHWFTGMHCPERVGDIPRLGQIAYNRGGSDVGCEYASPENGLRLSIFMRRHAPPAIPGATHFGDAQRAITLRYPAARRIHERTYQQATGGGTLNIQEADFDLSGVDAATNQPVSGSTGLWLSPIGDWDAKIRISYPQTRNLEWARALAAQVFEMISRDAEAARACAAQPVEVSRAAYTMPDSGAEGDARAMMYTLSGSTLAAVFLVQNSLPADTALARAAGDVCLEQPQDYPARVLRRRADVVVTGAPPEINAEILYRGEPLYAGPAVWGVVVADVAEEVATHAPAQGRIIQMFSADGDAIYYWGVAENRLSLPGLTAAIAVRGLPLQSRISIGPDGPVIQIGAEQATRN